MHIGLIGGIGPAATVYYYERIVGAFDAAGANLNLTIAHTSARTLSGNVAAGRIDAQVDEYLRVTNQLSAAGATAVAITSMGGHFCAPQFTRVSPLPLLNGPEAVAADIQTKGIRRIGILGTRTVMQTRLYGFLDRLAVVPDEQGIAQVNDDYIAMATAGRATPEQRSRLLAAGRDLIANHGAEAVLLGGTDLNIVYDESVDIPFIDSAAIHADAIAAAALGAG